MERNDTIYPYMTTSDAYRCERDKRDKNIENCKTDNTFFKFHFFLSS